MQLVACPGGTGAGNRPPRRAVPRRPGRCGPATGFPRRASTGRGTRKSGAGTGGRDGRGRCEAVTARRRPCAKRWRSPWERCGSSGPGERKGPGARLSSSRRAKPGHSRPSRAGARRAPGSPPAPRLADRRGIHGSAPIAPLGTAFAADYGQGSPVIAYLLEYDALPGVGHGCGHNGRGTLGPVQPVERILGHWTKGIGRPRR
jgi:hypothetical protein